MFQAIKNSYRRWQLRRRGIVRQRTLETFSAGDRSGVWTVLPGLLDHTSVVYSFGVGNNLAWDLALIARFGLTLHAFDPTPASLAWVAQQNLPANLVFHPAGLADRDGTLRLALPRRADSFNYRSLADPLHPPTATLDVPVSRLATHMQKLGHDRLDVLKMDIEGAEYAVLADLTACRIPVRQLLVEFHHHYPGVGLDATQRTIQALDQAGYRIFHISERGLEISFLHD